jgi:hypothetical protein
LMFTPLIHHRHHLDRRVICSRTAGRGHAVATIHRCEILLVRRIVPSA